jgi:hypothetical protein
MHPEGTIQVEERMLAAAAAHFGRQDFSESYARLARAIIHAIVSYDRDPQPTAEQPSPDPG